MAIRTPTFTGQFNAPDARFNIPTRGVSSRVPVNTSNMKTQNILDFIGGVQKIAGDISDRYSASEFQTLTSDFEREKTDLFDRTTADVNNYNEFATNGMKGHADLVKKYEKLAKEKNLNPDFSNKLKSYTLNSGDLFKNSLVNNARRIEPQILRKKAENNLVSAITNLRGAHPDSNPNTRAIKYQLFLMLDRMAPVVGLDVVSSLKRNYLNNSEKAFFQTMVKDNPGFFIPDHEDYTGFKFSYTNADDIAANVAKAESIDKQIKNEIEKNRIKDTSAIDQGLDALGSSGASIEINMIALGENPQDMPKVIELMEQHGQLVNEVKTRVLSNPDLTSAKRKSILEKLALQEAKVTNDIEYLNTIGLLFEQTSVESVKQMKNDFIKRGTELTGHLAKDFKESFSNRLNIFDKQIERIEENVQINFAATNIKQGNYNPDDPTHKKARMRIINEMPLHPAYTRVGDTNSDIPPNEFKSLNRIQLVNRTFFNTSGERRGSLGPGALQAVEIARLTGEFPKSTLKKLSDIINNQMTGEEDDVRRGTAMKFIIDSKDNLALDDDTLEKFGLLKAYQKYTTGPAVMYLSNNELGQTIRNDNETRTKRVGLLGSQQRDIDQEIEHIYKPRPDGGGSIFGEDIYNHMIAREAGMLDSIGLRLGKLLKIRNAIDGKRAEKNINDIVSPEKTKIYMDPEVRKNLKHLHKMKVKLLVKQGYNPEESSKMAAVQIATLFQPTLLGPDPFGYMMPDNTSVNESDDTSFEHGNRIAVALQEYYKGNPEMQVYFKGAFRTGRVTATSSVSRPNWVLGDKSKVRVDAMHFEVAGKDVKIFGEKVFVPYTGEKAMAYTENLTFKEGSDREFWMINPDVVNLIYNGKDEANRHTWKITVDGVQLQDSDGLALLYTPANNPANRRAQESAKFDRKRKGISRLMNNIGRQALEMLQP